MINIKPSAIMLYSKMGKPKMYLHVEFAASTILLELSGGRMTAVKVAIKVPTLIMILKIGATLG
jgi:hypothetical protein